MAGHYCFAITTNSPQAILEREAEETSFSIYGNMLGLCQLRESTNCNAPSQLFSIFRLFQKFKTLSINLRILSTSKELRALLLLWSKRQTTGGGAIWKQGGSENDWTKIFSTFTKNRSLAKIKLHKTETGINFFQISFIFSIRSGSYQQTAAEYSRKYYTDGRERISQ